MMDEEKYEEWKEYFIFLNVLRESGKTNMFGASSYLAEHFEDDDMSDKQWREVVMFWMQNFGAIDRRLNA